MTSSILVCRIPCLKKMKTGWGDRSAGSMNATQEWSPECGFLAPTWKQLVCAWDFSACVLAIQSVHNVRFHLMRDFVFLHLSQTHIPEQQTRKEYIYKLVLITVCRIFIWSCFRFHSATNVSEMSWISIKEAFPLLIEKSICSVQHTIFIPAFGRQKQKDYKFEAAWST